LQIINACEQFFAIRVSDLTHAQLKSVVNLIRQSTKRLPETYQNFIFSNALGTGESILEIAEMLQQCSPVMFSDTVTEHCVTSPEQTGKMTSGYKSDSKVQSCSDTHKIMQVLKSVAVNKITNKEKQNDCETPTLETSSQ
jgi:hypothetical protein